MAFICLVSPAVAGMGLGSAAILVLELSPHLFSCEPFQGEILKCLKGAYEKGERDLFHGQTVKGQWGNGFE